MELYLIRHAESIGNASGSIQGAVDYDLTDRGRQQAELLAERLNEIRLSAIYSSPMKRARDTALPIARAKEMDVQRLEWLREVDTSHLSGLSRSDLDRIDPGFLQDSRRREGLPSGETNTEFYGRVADGYDQLVERLRGTDQVVALVAHYATLNAVICRALGIPYLPRFVFANASVSRIVFRPMRGEETSQVSFLNDITHWLGKLG